MRDVLRLLRATPRASAACIALASLLYCALPIPLGLATRAFFDSFAPGAAGLTAGTAVALVVASQIGAVLAEASLSRAWSAQQLPMHSLLQRNLFAGVLRGFGRRGLRVSPAEAVSRFRDDPPTISMGSVDALCDLIGRALFAVVALIVMARIDPLLAAVAFAPIVLSSLVTDALGTRASRYGAESRQAKARITGFLGQLVHAQLAMKVAGAGPHAVERLTVLGDERRRLSLRDSVFAMAVHSMNLHVAHVSTGLVLLVGAGRVRAGSFSVGDLALFVVYLDQLTYLPAEIGRLLTERKQTRVCLDRMHRLMPDQPRRAVIVPGPPAVPLVTEALRELRVDGLTALHPSSGRGVEGVSFLVRRGTVTVVTGRVGAGKSTLLHAVLGLIARQGGTLHWNDLRIDDPATVMVPPRTAFTPQVPQLFSDTLAENLTLGLVPADADRVDRAVRTAVLDRDLPALEAGLDTRIGRRGVKLSGGQVQRVAVARMLVREPDLVVFDDLSSALDVATEAELWRRLFASAAAPTCLVVSHRPAVLRRADQVLLLEDGRLADAGTLDELLGRSAAMRALWIDEDKGREPRSAPGQ